MKLLEVNTVVNGGSIPEYIRSIVAEAQRRGYDVAVAKSRSGSIDGVLNIQVGNSFDVAVHGLATRIFDRHGLLSRRATERFIAEAECFAPDIIHLHNIHGYYLHYPTLFSWLGSYGRPVLWSLHDCWAFTGHCPFYTSHDVKCERWRTGCGKCPLKSLYPSSLCTDRSAANLVDKVRAFTSISNLILLPVSDWLAGELAQSKLSAIPRETVKIDVDLAVFKPSVPSQGHRTVLGVASNWNPLKGLEFFIKLREQLPKEVEIRLVGSVPCKIPAGINALGTVSDRSELAREYSMASVFVNPTYADNYPMTNHEAFACGTPIVSRNVGGALEDIMADNLPVWGAETDEELSAAVAEALCAGKDSREAMRRAAEELYGPRPYIYRLFEIIERF